MTINLISYQLSSCCHILLLDFYSLFPGRHVIKISSNKISQPRDSSKASWVNGRVNEDLSPSLFHGQKFNHLFQSKVIGLLKRNWWTTREILLLLYIYTGCFLFSYFIVSYFTLKNLDHGKAWDLIQHYWLDCWPMKLWEGIKHSPWQYTGCGHLNPSNDAHLQLLLVIFPIYL